MTVLQLDHVTKTSGAGRTAVRAVDDVSLSVAPGELIVVMGPSDRRAHPGCSLTSKSPEPTAHDGDVANIRIVYHEPAVLELAVRRRRRQ